MLSRRKFLQGALGFASAAILPSGVIMPIREIATPKYLDWRWGYGHLQEIDDGQYIYGSDMRDHVHTAIPEHWNEQQLYDSIMKAKTALDEADVPQDGRWIHLTEKQYGYHLLKNST